MVSFATRGAYGGFDYMFSTTPYQQLLFIEGWTGETEFNPQYLAIIGRTIVLATLTTLISTPVGSMMSAATDVRRYRGFGTFTVIFFAYLNLPIAVVVFYSFNENRIVSSGS